MKSDIINISDCFASVVDAMRPTGTKVSLTKIGTSNLWNLVTNKVYTSGDYNVAAYDYIDLLDSTGATVGSYMITAINQSTKTLTIEILTAPTGTVASWKSKAPYFEHGHYLEIENTLKQKNKDATLKFQKYPLIVLIQDIKENQGNSSLTYSEPSVTVFIVAPTNKNLNAEERKAATFTPILKPLLFNLSYRIHYSKLFKTIDYTEIPKQAIERYFWGRAGEFANESGIFSDWLDAIEIPSMNLKVKQTSHTPTNQLIKF